MNDTREVIRCPKCTLVQFKPSSDRCRRCRFSLAPVPEPTPAPEPIRPSKGIVSAPLVERPLDEGLIAVIKAVRFAHGLSQRDLSCRMRCPRTYISKIENGKATPNVASIRKIADALGISSSGLIHMAEIASRAPATRAAVA